MVYDDDDEFSMQAMAAGDFHVFKTLRFLAALTNIASRPWFRRTWVIQELVLVADVFFTCSFTWGSLDRFSQAIGAATGTRPSDILDPWDQKATLSESSSLPFKNAEIENFLPIQLRA